METPSEPSSNDSVPLFSHVSCQKCGRQDETVRSVVYPYVFSLVVFTFRQAFAGIWCQRHRTLYHTLATLITSVVGWFGFPFGIIYTPIALFQLAKGGSQPPSENKQILKNIAFARIQAGDYAKARKCLEAALQYGEDPQIKDHLVRLYAAQSAREESSSFGSALTQVFLVTLLLSCTALIGGIAGLVSYFASDAIFGAFGDSLSYIQLVLGWLPLVGCAILAIFMVRNLQEWTLERAHFTQPVLAVVLGLLTSALLIYGILEGRAISQFIGMYEYAFMPSGIELVRIIGAVLTRGGAFEILQKLNYNDSFWLIYLILFSGLAVFALAALQNGASAVTAWQRRLAEYQETVNVRLPWGNIAGWVMIGVTVLGLVVLVSAFPQKSVIDYLEAYDHLYAAYNLEEEERMEAAQVEVEKAIAMYPGLPEPHLEYGVLLYYAGDLDKSITEAQKAVEIAPDWAYANASLGQAYLYADKRNLARASFNKALSIEPDNYLAHLNMGWLELQETNIGSAETHFKEAIQAYPSSVEAYLGLAVVNEYRKDLDGSMAAYQKIVEIDPTSPEGNSGLGWAYIYKNDLEQGTKHLEKAFRLDKENVRSRADLVTVYMGQSKIDRSIELCQEAISADPDQPAFHALLAMAYYASGQEDLAHQALEKAAALPSLTDDDYMRKVEAFSYFGKYDHAEAELLAGIDTGTLTGKIGAYLELADVYSSEGKVAEALAACDRAEESNDPPSDVLLQRGIVYLDAGKYAESVEQLNKAIELDPNSSRARSMLSIAFSRLKMYDLAVEEAKQAVSLDSLSSIGPLSLGIAYLGLEQYPQAVEAANQALKIHPVYDIPHYILGMSAYQTGDLTTAAKELNLFMKQYRERPFAKEYYKTVEATLKKLK